MTAKAGDIARARLLDKGFSVDPFVLHAAGMVRPEPTVHIRPATVEDRPAAMRLAPRLQVGVAPWHDQAAIADGVAGWVSDAVDSISTDDRRACFVATDAMSSPGSDQRIVVGFISVQVSQHWSGTEQAYIGELMVDEAAEGRGVGRALVDRAAAWARDQGCRRIALDTGAANAGARRFYRALGFDEEDVRLSRAL